jgi:hypothetical protein
MAAGCTSDWVLPRVPLQQRRWPRRSETFAGVTYMHSRRRVGLSGEIYFAALRFTVGFNLGGI